MSLMESYEPHKRCLFPCGERCNCMPRPLYFEPETPKFQCDACEDGKRICACVRTDRLAEVLC